MTDAYNAVLARTIKANHAAKAIGVPRTMLRDRLSGRVSQNAKIGRKSTLNQSEEQKLIDYATNRAQLGIGFGKEKF